VNGFAPTIRTAADVEAFERIPLELRVQAWTVHEIVARGAALNPGAAVLHYLLDADPAEAPRTISFAEFMRKVHQTANLLRRLFDGRDGIVGVLLPLVPENYFLLCGGPSAGILCPVNWALKPPQIATILNAAGAQALVALGPTPGFDIWETAEQVLNLAPGIRHILQVRGPGGTTDPERDFGMLIAGERGDGFSYDRRARPEDTAIYCHTGGTTGSPKLAKLSHRGIAYKCHAYAWVLGHGPGDVVFAGIPLFHSGGIVNRTLSPIFSGITSVIVSPHGFRAPKSRENFWKLVERYHVTEITAPPTVLAAMISRPAGDADLSTLKKYANTGSAGLPAATAREFEEKFGVRILANYGLTENTASAAFSPRGGEPRFGASGIRLPYTRIKTVIVGRDGTYLRDGAEGESGVIAVKGRGVISGYVDEQLNRGLFFPDRWLNTGDLGRIDADGFVWITGRVKDLIIRGGNNIDASSVDETVLQHPAVELAAAVGKPDAYAGELPVAYVQLRPGAAASAEEIKEFARSRISEPGASPVEVFIIDRMPLTEVGKIFKPPLRRDAAQRTFTPALAAWSAQRGLAAQVEVLDDPTSGLCARITLTSSGSTPDGVAASEVRALMDRYTIAYEVRWKNAAENRV
jgi:fatty-acyl-CoA synthase